MRDGDTRRAGGNEPGWLRSLEEARGGPWVWLVLLIGWILVRNLLEGVLEPPYELGFDWRGEVSFPMLFLHFPLFYLGLFLAISLWLHLVTGRPLARVARLVTLGFAVILVAPPIDALLSEGRGYDLRYLLHAGSVLWRFWDPLASLAEVSPGQRVEILAAVLLGGAYAWRAARRRALLAAGGALVGIYLLAAAFGAWPALFAQLTRPRGGGSEAAYVALYQGAGLIACESRRLALAMTLPALAGLLLFLGRLAPRPLGAIVRHIGWTRLCFYSGLAPAGALLGWILYRPYVPGAYANPIDFVATLVLWLALAAAYLAAWAWNALHDQEGDRLDAPERPLPAGWLSPAAMARLGSAAAAVALVLALTVGYVPFLLTLACLFLSWLYSVPPVRLKRWPIVATATLGALSGLSLCAGFSLFGQEMTLRAIPGGILAFLVIGVTLGFTAKDLKDVAGDRAAGTVTIATLFGPRRGRLAIALLVALGYLSGMLLLPPLPLLRLLVLGAALLAVAITLGRRRPDGWLMVELITFALLLLFMLARTPGLLSGGAPEELRRMHGTTRAVEEQVRLERRGDAGLSPAAGKTSPRALAAAADGGERADWLTVLGARAGEEGRWARLLTRRPLRYAYHDRRVVGAAQAEAHALGVRACSAALAGGVRPGEFLRQRAALRLAAGDAAGAIARDLEGAFLFAQEEGLLWTLFGDLARREGDPPLARRAYREAIRRRPGAADAWAGLGALCHQQGELHDAIEALATAARLRPGDPWALNNWGVALRDARRWDEAREQLTRAHQMAPAMFEPLFNLGRLDEVTGRREQACRWYRAAAHRRPGFAPVERALERVCLGGAERRPEGPGHAGGKG